MESNIAKISFSITSGAEESFSDINPISKLTIGKFKLEYEGDLEGESVLTELRHYRHKSSASIYGLELVTGVINGRHGSFVVEHKGEFENGITNSLRTIVPGSGTDELKGVTGNYAISSGSQEKYDAVMEYTFGTVAAV
ncbi:MAG: DUF3224 domain-containing protein [Chitinophagaceae bacterium]|nr:DUF3224 domain-containing protein [Chitinophagaceae bacterium]